ncbi:hypothetical protein G7Y89_g27 [Cudoniella acicularis]|uniref:Uncharacterized protein n=1 Tax=Cudoniella acicularis TaxID=354080 RepID=A0A8H4RYY9_9HELO|nr:hypothetical protein G7Y89_g27 [Cudoniella acicularis]
MEVSFLFDWSNTISIYSPYSHVSYEDIDTIEFELEYIPPLDITSHLSYFECSVTPLGHDPMGQVSDGKFLASEPMRKIYRAGSKSETETPEDWLSLVTGSWNIILDIAKIEEDERNLLLEGPSTIEREWKKFFLGKCSFDMESVERPREHWCLLASGHCGLVLEPVLGLEDTFRRVGIFAVYQYDGMNPWEETRVTII